MPEYRSSVYWIDTCCSRHIVPWPWANVKVRRHLCCLAIDIDAAKFVLRRIGWRRGVRTSTW